MLRLAPRQIWANCGGAHRGKSVYGAERIAFPLGKVARCGAARTVTDEGRPPAAGVTAAQCRLRQICVRRGSALGSPVQGELARLLAFNGATEGLYPRQGIAFAPRAVHFSAYPSQFSALLHYFLCSLKSCSAKS